MTDRIVLAGMEFEGRHGVERRGARRAPADRGRRRVVARPAPPARATTWPTRSTTAGSSTLPRRSSRSAASICWRRSPRRSPRRVLAGFPRSRRSRCASGSRACPSTAGSTTPAWRSERAPAGLTALAPGLRSLGRVPRVDLESSGRRAARSGSPCRPAVLAQDLVERVRAVDALVPSIVGDDVAFLQAGLLRRADRRRRPAVLAVRCRDARAVVDGQASRSSASRAVDRHVVDAHPRPRERLAGDGLLHDRLGDVDRDGEADALRVAGDGGVDADDVARGVDQRAARVAGVDRRVGLDQVAQRRAAGRSSDRSPRGRGRAPR